MNGETDSNLPAADSAAYRLLATLVPGQTFLCCDDSDNVLVLKRLEGDCLHRGELHPSIKSRLARIRELPHPRVAVLRSVERWEADACLVWTYLEGQTWDDAIADPRANVLQLCSDLAVALARLHENGIIHGSIHGRNVILRGDGQVWLTHLSPYLYTEPLADAVAVADLIRGLAGRFEPGPASRFLALVGSLESGQMGLREFSHAIVEVPKDPLEAAPVPGKQARAYRLRSLGAAVAVAMLGAAGWFWIRGLESKFQPVATAGAPGFAITVAHH